MCSSIEKQEKVIYKCRIGTYTYKCIYSNWKRYLLFKFFVFVLLDLVDGEQFQIDKRIHCQLPLMRDRALVYHVYLLPDRKRRIYHRYKTKSRRTHRLILPKRLFKCHPRKEVCRTRCLRAIFKPL